MAVSRGVRTAWIVGGSVFTLVTLGFGTLQAVAGLAHEERTIRTTIDEPIRAIDIEATGSVTVRGGDGRTVMIRERVSDGLHRPARSMTVDRGVLTIRGTCVQFPATFCSDDFELRVPGAVAVRIRSRGAAVDNVRGGVDVRSDGDDISLQRVAGAVRLSSHGGTITGTALEATSVETASYGGDTTLSFLVAPRRVAVTSYGGDIFVGLPEGPLAYRVDASANGGSTDTAVRTDPSSSRIVRADSYGGDIDIRYTGTE
jgi:hypothetical protein